MFQALREAEKYVELGWPQNVTYFSFFQDGLSEMRFASKRHDTKVTRLM
jgi:hypothetical protein